MNTMLKGDIPANINERKSQYDAICKKILAHKVILAWILKGCTEEFKDCSIDDIAKLYIEGKPEIAQSVVHQDQCVTPLIQGSNTEDTSPSEGKVTYDIKFIANAPASGEPIRLIINIEAQNKSNPGYPLIKRALYYCSRMISAQYGREFTKSHYEEIKKVYSIWICPRPSIKNRNSIIKYQLEPSVICGYSDEQKANYDIQTAIIVNLGAESKQDPKSLLKLLTLLLKSKKTPEEKASIISTEYEINMTDDMKDEVEHMCNLSEGVYEEGMKKGLEQGENRFASLMAHLYELGRMEDAKRVVKDEAYRALLMKEFSIQ